ncbi:SDR family oxidoreductase [Acuticoccus sp. MNP-M23]|uniref:SDR family NAD(P)-dependent oxidoreductase n=1 Tax=Acuticoccus sp. MNP-M23 TaxID=3072793 RepID=UPI0028157109|nr:SDR family oxidoreductase [Acuticoccus sp. MNP-M23]WMS43550.1 SDR family oxidoreductase [Acuticoccus sp. MNP-M23]
MSRLEGKKAVVIGSGTGIGRAVVQLFAREGADILAADHGKDDELASLRAEVEAMGQTCLTAAVDVRNPAEIDAAIARAHEAFGRIDVLVNNAGVSAPKKPFQEHDAAVWDAVLSVNLMGVAHAMRAVVPIMLAQGSGSIINTASQLAHKPAPGNSIYCASKAGVVALSVSVAQEVAADGVRVNIVCPGPIDTPMWRTGAAGNPAWAEWKLNSLPAKRLGTPEEAAHAYVYLASDESTYMIGQSVSPNGGDVMW